MQITFYLQPIFSINNFVFINTENWQDYFYICASLKEDSKVACRDLSNTL